MQPVYAVLFYNSYCHRALCRQMTVSISGSYHVYLSFLFRVFLPEGPVLRPGFLISPGLLRTSDPVDDCERLLLAALFLRASLFLLSSSSCASCFWWFLCSMYSTAASSTTRTRSMTISTVKVWPSLL